MSVKYRYFDLRVGPKYSGDYREVSEWFNRFQTLSATLRGLCERAARADHRGRVRHLCRPHAGRTLARGRGPAEVLAALLDACTPSWADAYDDFLARRLRPGETVEEYLQVLRGLVALFIKGPVPDSGHEVYERPAGGSAGAASYKGRHPVGEKMTARAAPDCAGCPGDGGCGA